MSAQFDSGFPSETYMPVNQQLMYTLSDTGGAVSADHRFIVWVSKGSTQLCKLYVTANDQGKGFFDLSQIIKSTLSMDEVSGLLSLEVLWDCITGVCKSVNATDQFKLEIGTFSGSSESGVEATKYLYGMGGHVQLRQGTVSFADYYATAFTKKVWLTDRWADSVGGTTYYLADEDDMALAWIHDSNIIAGGDTKVRYQLFNAAGTQLGSTVDGTISTIGGNALNSTVYTEKIHYLMAGPANVVNWVGGSGQPSSHPTWSYYTLQLSASRGFKSAKMTVHKDCGVYKNERTLVAYANGVGGWDYIAFDGNASKQVQSSAKTYNKLAFDHSGAIDFTPTVARETATYHMTATMNYTLKRHGMGIEEYTQLESLMKSKQVLMKMSGSSYLTDRNVWLPLTVQSKSQTIHDKEEGQMFDVALEVQLAQDERC